jgi:multidrug efflux pump subunit AcrB
MNLKQLLPNYSEEKLSQNFDKAIKQTEKSVAGFFIKKYRITYLFLLIIILSGFYAIFTLPKEAEPEVKVPFAVVSVSYPGASPPDVEELITDKIEEKIKNLDGMKEYSSTSGIGSASISVEFNAEADIDKSIRELKDAVDEAKPELPEDANDPYVSEINFNDMPIVTYSLVGDYNDFELKNFADTLQTAFEQMPDVSKVPIIGGIEREFQIIINQANLAKYNLSLNQIVSALSSSNINIPAGDIDIDGYKYNVRVKGKFENDKDISNVIVTYSNNAPIYIGEIGEVLDTTKEKNTESRIGIGNNNPQNTISLQIYKKTGGNILNIADNAEKTIQDINNQNIFPENLTIIKTNDNSTYIKDDISRLGTSGMQTMVLIILLLFAVLGIRGALITGFSVPIAFLMAFIFIMWQGMTINSMVLFSLVLSLGLMVDNSIIVMEGINEYIHKYNKTTREAALLSVWNYKWAIISGTMTTVAAFLPMLLVSGIMGEYMGILPKTVTATLISSLFVALIIIPALSARFYKKVDKNNNDENKKIHRSQKIRNKIEDLQIHYVNFLKKTLPSKKKRRQIILGAIVLMFLTIMLPVVGIMKVNMFPKVDIDYFAVNIELPIGSTLEKTKEITTKAEGIIREIPELDNYVSSIGSGFSAYAGDSGGSGSHVSSIIVNLVGENNRNRKSYEVADSVRDKLESIQGGNVKLQELSAGPPTGAPFEAKITGTDLNKLSNIAEEVKNILNNIDGLINIKDSLTETSGEFTFTINREKVKYYGLDVNTVAMSIRQAIYGAEATTMNIDGDDIDVTVKYSEESLENINDLKNLLIFSPTVGSVMIQQVADLTIEPSVFGIQHIDGEKVVRITAETTAEADLRKIMSEFSEKSAGLELPEKYKIKTGGETEDIQKSFTEIFMSLFVALFLIMFILIMQFNSFKKPFVILFSLPLAIVGAFFGLTILRLDFSLPAFIGIVSLTGIVVNDSIVLIDRIEKNLSREMDFFEGVIEAGLARTQPIFLTSITTIAGVFPLALSEAMWAGLGFSLIFGLIFSTVLTLVFIPVVYTSLCQKDYYKNK